MKPKTKLQKQVVELSNQLPPLTEAQREYPYKHLFKNTGYYWKKGEVWCQCCGHVQSVGNFKAIGADPDRAYSNCIGRVTGSNDSTGKKGCNYTINGLISLNKTTVISDKYLPVKVFEMAD